MGGAQTCQVERGGISSMLVAAVNVLRGKELLHPVQVPPLGGIEEGHLPPEEVHQVSILVLDHLQGGQVILVLTVGIRTILHKKSDGEEDGVG